MDFVVVVIVFGFLLSELLFFFFTVVVVVVVAAAAAAADDHDLVCFGEPLDYATSKAHHFRETFKTKSNVQMTK